MTSQFLDRLKAAHDRIGVQIAAENRLVQPDFMRLSKLKKTKLSLKDRMARLLAHSPQATDGKTVSS